MRTRLTLTKRLADDLYLSESVYPDTRKMGRPSAGGLILAFVLGAVIFIFFCLVFIAVFAP